jgi:hypothetical protein
MSSVPMDENVKTNDSLTNSLLQVNNLLYRMSPQLGICARRNHRIDFAQQSTYSPSETIVYDCQTGSDFVGAKNSYLKLKVSCVGAAGDLASGSICNIINRVVVRSRTGKEISRVENFNLLAKNIQVWNCDNEWKSTAGKAQGYGTGSSNPNEVPTTGKVFIIPMWVIPCFQQERLLPPQLMSGCRIEITLESTGTAFLAIGPSPSGYIVDRPEIHWDTYDLADAYKRKIAEMASRQGLVLLHKEYFHTIVSGSNSDFDFNFDIKKACSKALKAMIITRASDSVNNTAYDSMGAQQYDYSQYQSRIGADYFPNAPLTVDDISVNGNAESYYHTLFVFDKVANCWNPSSVTPNQYLSDNPPANTLADHYCNSLIAFNYNKSHVSDLQGYIVSNSRSILIDLKALPIAGAYPTGTTNSRRLDVYLQYLRATKVYISNVEVKD